MAQLVKRNNGAAKHEIAAPNLAKVRRNYHAINKRAI